MNTSIEGLQPEVERQSLDVDIACVGFGPAMGGFLTTLSRALQDTAGGAPLESKVMPGMPPQVICYERADDIGFGVSGVVTRALGIRSSFPQLDPAQIPMCVPVKEEKLIYLLDPAVPASARWPCVPPIGCCVHLAWLNSRLTRFLSLPSSCIRKMDW